MLLYRSPDLLDWAYRHPLFVGDKDDRFVAGYMWECPDFFALDGKHVLIVSAFEPPPAAVPLHQVVYFVGSYEDERFIPGTQGFLDVGGHFYAPQTLRDVHGRRLIWGWLWEGRDNPTLEAAGWAGVMSLPRVLSILSDGALGVQPAAELRALREAHVALTPTAIAADTTTGLDGIAGDCLEIVAAIALGDAVSVGLNVRCSPDRAEHTTIDYDRQTGRLTLDCERASLLVAVDRPAHATELPLAPDEPLRIHIFLDRSVIEVYANNRLCITDRVYPSRSDSLGVELFARGGQASLVSLDSWRMRSIWTNADAAAGPAREHACS